MQEFFTWSMLATYAGAVLATTMITQLLKGMPLICRLPTRLFSYIVALILLLLSAFFTHQLTIGTALLSLINAAVVSFASNGTYDASKLARIKIQS